MSDSESNISFKDPNGSAFVMTETRKGPPLGFIGEKLYQALVYTHRAYLSVMTYIPDDFPQPPAWQRTDFTVKKDGLLNPIRGIFCSQFTAFLGLYNLLALDNNPSLIDRLLAMSSLEFRSWLSRISKAGCVTG